MLGKIFKSNSKSESTFTDNFDSLWRAYFKEKPTPEEYTKVSNRPEDKIKYILTFYHPFASESVKYGALKRLSKYLDELDVSEYHY